MLFIIFLYTAFKSSGGFQLAKNVKFDLFISLAGCILFSAGGTARLLNRTFTNIQIALLRSFCPMPDTQASIPLVCDARACSEQLKNITRL